MTTNTTTPRDRLGKSDGFPRFVASGAPAAAERGRRNGRLAEEGSDEDWS
jgi:hypothetical protein